MVIYVFILKIILASYIIFLNVFISDGIFKGVAYIVYSEIDNAKEAVDKLNNSTLNDKIIKVKLTRQKDNEDNYSHPAAKSEANQEGSVDQEKTSKKKKWADRNQKSKKNRNGRIIIRNLSFKVKKKFM